MKKGQKHSLESIEKMKAIHKSIPTWNDGSEKARQRIEQVRTLGKIYGKRPKSLRTREKLSLVQKRENCVTSENDRVRHSWKYKIWKKAVLARDGYKCVQCGGLKNLHVDHIKEFAFYPELRFEISNGRVLCFECHRKTETWGPRYRTSALQASA